MSGATAWGKTAWASPCPQSWATLREIYRLHEGELLAGIDLVVVARVRSAGYDYHQLERDFLRACVKLGLYARQGGESGKTP